MTVLHEALDAPEVERGEEQIQRSAVINPYALAELVAGRKIPWKRIENRPQLLEELLQTPYEQLFDPKHDSPLYLGFKLNKKGELERVRPSLLDVETDAATNDLANLPDVDLTGVRKLGDLGRVLETKDVAAIPVERAAMTRANAIEVTLRPAEKQREKRLARVFTRDVIETVVYLPQREPGFYPPNTTWRDDGRFFNEAAEFFDPIQGAVANCYLIAAMASVAWARPTMVRHLTRATGQNQEQFTNMIRFWDIDQGYQTRDLEVTDAIIVSSGSGAPVYCRSSEPGEIWPGVYEKAFAKWKTNVAHDHPDITATAWGDCVRASAELTGLQRHYYATASLTGDQLWDIVRANSLSYRTFNPMTAATYGSGESSPDKVVYSEANLVAAHCYSVLGWAYRDGRKYIVLRNPWGNTEATYGELAGTAWFHDVSWWRPIALGDPDGVFALRVDVFKSYFGWLGVVS